MPLGVNYSADAYGHCVVMEWVATIAGDCVGYPRFGGFFSKEKNFGEQKFARLSASNFHNRILNFLFLSVNFLDWSQYFFSNNKNAKDIKMVGCIKSDSDLNQLFNRKILILFKSISFNGANTFAQTIKIQTT
jgi:hypothetical protein